jgi:hypothetical protein
VPPAGEHADQAEARAHVPALAPRLAEIVVGHAQPLVVAGIEQHPLDEQAGTGLVAGQAQARDAELVRAVRELVAHRLELPEREQARAGTAGDDGQRQTRVRGGGDLDEL